MTGRTRSSCWTRARPGAPLGSALTPSCAPCKNVLGGWPQQALHRLTALLHTVAALQVLHHAAAGARPALPPHHLPQPVHAVPRQPHAAAPLVSRPTRTAAAHVL
jgi:hypothetical protein